MVGGVLTAVAGPNTALCAVCSAARLVGHGGGEEVEICYLLSSLLLMLHLVVVVIVVVVIIMMLDVFCLWICARACERGKAHVMASQERSEE